MKPSLESKYNHYYSLHCKHLKLQGLQPKTIEAYSRAIRRIATYFNGHLDNLSQDQLLGNRQLNPPSQTIAENLKAEFFQSLPRVKTTAFS